SRHGSFKAKERFSYPLKTELPNHRDKLWYSDGTKLNFYYKPDKGGMKADRIVYEVMDAYSEVLLGFCIGESENFTLMYHSFKSALQFSQYKPFQLVYDNGSGHKKLSNEGFFDSMARVTNPTTPNNGKS